jgi:hypothetical protein
VLTFLDVILASRSTDNDETYAIAGEVEGELPGNELGKITILEVRENKFALI